MPRPKTADTRRRAALAMKREGASNADIAEHFGVSTKTAHYWVTDAEDLPDTPAVVEPADPEDYAARFRKARAEKMEADAAKARLSYERLKGQVIPRRRVLTFLTSLQARISTGSATLKRLSEGDAAIAIFQEAFKGLNEESDIMLGEND